MPKLTYVFNQLTDLYYGGHITKHTASFTHMQVFEWRSFSPFHTDSPNGWVQCDTDHVFLTPKIKAVSKEEIK